MAAHIGIYAGTFDPVHPGHIAFALGALADCQLDTVVFLPEHLPRYKQQATSIEQRIALLETTIQDTPELRVLQLESERFTVRGTLPELRDIFAGAQLMFLVGSDVVRNSLPNWVDLGIFLRSTSLAIGLRGKDTPEHMAEIMQLLTETHGADTPYTCIRTGHAELSSTHIRRNGGHALQTKATATFS